MSNRRCSAHRRAAAALLALATVVVVLVTPARPAAAQPTLPRTPATGSVTLVGAGFGHGRGMGQWGAYGYALQGWSWLQILRHFYPGSQDGIVDDQQEMTVRLAGMHGVTTAVVSVRADGTPNVTSEHDGFVARYAAMAAVDVGDGVFDVYAGPGCPLAGTNFADTASGWVKVTTDTDRSVVFRPGDLAGSYTTSVLTDLLAVCEPDGDQRAFRGQIESFDDGRQRTVNRTTLQAYLRGVVPRESPPSWGDGIGINALGAQAVAARSYGVSENRFRFNGVLYAKTCDDQDCQVFGGAGLKAAGKTTFSRLEDSRTDQAITLTAGAVRLTPDGSRVAVTEFSASTGGLTTGGTFAPGVSYAGVVDDGDDVAGNPNHRWTTTLTNATIESAYPTIGSLVGLRVTKRDGVGEWGGRVLQLELRGTAATVTTSGETFRGRTGIKSSWFAIVDDCDGREVPELTTLPAVAPADFEPVNPLRLLDTRDGTGTSVVAPLQGGCALALQVGGRDGIPADATAAALNVTVTEATGQGYVTAWPCGAARPEASTVNLSPGRAVANLSVVRIGAGGQICLFSQTTTELVVDVTGWFGPTAGQGFQPLAPERLVDTRIGTGGRAVPLQPNEVHPVKVASIGGVPAGATAASLQVTVTRPLTEGWVRVFPCGGTVPPSSTVNFLAGDDVPNHAFVGLGTDGTVCVQANTRTDVVLDVQGWFGAAAPGRFVPVVPTRRFDTRSGAGGVPDSPVRTGETLSVPMLGRAGVPASGVLAVLVNLTSDEATGAGFVTAFPCGTSRRETSVLNPRSGRILAGASPVLPGTDGSVCLYTMRQTELLGDVTAYVVP